MALSLTKTPDAYSLSGNPVIFEITTTTTGKDFHKLHARVTYDGTVVGEDALSAVSGKAEFDISDYLKEIINGHFEIVTDYTEYDIIKSFSIYYFETYDNDGIEHDPATSSTYKVVQGKIDKLNLLKLAAASESFYLNYIDKNNFHALTYREDNKYAYKHEDDFIYAYGNDALFYTRTVYFTLKDGSTQEKTINNQVNPDKIVAFSIGYNNFVSTLISNEAWKDDVFKYRLEFRITDDPLDITIFDHTYILKETTNYKQVIFKNTFGVYESIYFYGISEKESKYDRQFSEKDESDYILDVSNKQTLSINSGWISEGAYKNLLHLLNSKDSYLIEDSLQIPIVITSKKHKHNSDDNLYSLKLEINFAHTDYF